jgi:hypothetical protein
LYIVISSLEFVERTGPQSAADAGEELIQLLIVLIAKLNASPGVIQVSGSSEANDNEAPQRNAHFCPTTPRLSPESGHWKIEREVAGIVLRFC